LIKSKKESDEVLYVDQESILLKESDLDELKKLALLNPRQRIRLCSHETKNDQLHEMFIIHTKNCYVRPHKHLKKAESMFVLEGLADVILFYDDGRIMKSFEMGNHSSGSLFYHRLNNPIYHMLIIRTDFFVFHEVTQGPFSRSDTVFPEWAPSEYDINFMKKVDKEISKTG
jgi:cupin fold WbuC family metalloprotein